MEPAYFIENRYSPIVDFQYYIPEQTYEVDTPETAFERDVQRRLASANRLLMQGRFAAALAKYEDLRALIARTLRPQIGYVGSFAFDWGSVAVKEMSNALIAKSASFMKAAPLTEVALPDAIVAEEVKLSAGATKAFGNVSEIGVDTGDSKLGSLLNEASANIRKGKNDVALTGLNDALKLTKDVQLQSAIRHDIAAVKERSGDRASGIKDLQRAEKALSNAGDTEARLVVLKSLAGMQARDNKKAAATKSLETLKDAGAATTTLPNSGRNIGSTSGFSERAQPFDLTLAEDALGSSRVLAESRRTSAEPLAFSQLKVPLTLAEAAAEPVALIATKAFAERASTRTYSVIGNLGEVQKVVLDGNASKNLEGHYQLMQKTSDIALLQAWVYSPVHTIAYLTHVTQWVIPVAIGDCHAALGSYSAAEREYLRCLDYPYLNEVVEIVTLWIRLAELYVDWGDRRYRQARNDVSRFAFAREKYEQVITIDDKVNDASPLYSNPRFTALRQRAGAIIQNVFVAEAPNNDNPRLALALARARMQIRKIDAKLNYIGLGVYVPPFSFEYLQNIARYFAQHAAQVEQMYIQFQTSGENEELRAQQMAQQVELADASVELERRGLDEAESGIDVARANRDAAQQQLINAQQAAADFDDVRGELLEISALQAWASSTQGEDGDIRLTTTNQTYYRVEDRRRSYVLQDLATNRGRITNALEANRLDREIAAADAYRDVADAQIDQAEVRVDIARQRIQIAELQSDHAQDNLNFLNSKEFTSALWYDMAREARRIAGRYLDAAIEIATLMEKAYEAESGRDLRKIKFEYGMDKINGLLGADALLLDIDYFTLDHARTRSKRAPMRQVISLADNFPVAMEQLLSSGTAMFETTLDHFEQQYPGFYLQKVKAVELRMVGLTGTEGVHGTLRNVGLSQVRKKSGGIENQIYPGDVMPLSEYDIRHDAIVFQHDPKDLRLFENNGVATMWRLDLPLGTNTFDLRQILDIQLIIAYDGFFDPGLESRVKANLPTTSSASSGISLQLYAPDELFFLRANGTCALNLTPNLFPANQVEQKLSNYRLIVRGEAAAGLRIRVNFENLGAEHVFELDAEGRANTRDFTTPLGESLFDTVTFTVDPDENPGVDLSQIEDVYFFVEYDFDYRT